MFFSKKTVNTTGSSLYPEKMTPEMGQHHIRVSTIKMSS